MPSGFCLWIIKRECGFWPVSAVLCHPSASLTVAWSSCSSPEASQQGKGDADSWSPFVALPLTYLVDLKSSRCHFSVILWFLNIMAWFCGKLQAAALVLGFSIAVGVRDGSWRNVEWGGSFPCCLPSQLWVSFINPALTQLAMVWRCHSAAYGEQCWVTLRGDPLHLGLGVMDVLSKPLCTSGVSFQQGIREKHWQKGPCVTGMGGNGTSAVF